LDEEEDASGSVAAAAPPPEEPVGPDSIVQPSGFTRAEVIRKIEKNDMIGLTEADVKQVQDEMWLRQFTSLKGPMIRKDGTVRKKPGPAKGWKKMRREQGLETGSARGDDSDGGDTISVAGDTINGEADAEIAALLEGDGETRKEKVKVKRRKLDNGDEGTRYASENDVRLDFDEEDDERKSSIAGEAIEGSAKKPKAAKGKEPGVGKGKWTRPSKPEKDLLKAAEALAVQNAIQSQAISTGLLPEEVEMVLAMPGQDSADLLNQAPAPNTEDPRGSVKPRPKSGMVWWRNCRDRLGSRSFAIFRE
jgi:DNA helicase INO80